MAAILILNMHHKHDEIQTHFIFNNLYLICTLLSHYEHRQYMKQYCLRRLHMPLVYTYILTLFVKYDALMGAINDAYIPFRNSFSEHLLRELRKYAIFSKHVPQM